MMDCKFIYTDYHKAFDRLSHARLLLKMRNYFGIHDDDLKWFDSYLKDRYQRVVISGVESEWIPVFSGVPQGSILGPSLFLMYVNDLPLCLRSSECLMFADDVKIFKRISCTSDCIELQRDLTCFAEWCAQWKLDLNVEKCVHMNFSLKRLRNITYDYSLNSTFLKRLQNVKDLGVYYSSNMSFSLHVSSIVNKAFRMLGFLRRNMKSFQDVQVLKVLYNAYVRSHLDYCSPVWSPSSKILIDKIERVQKKFVKFTR